MDGRAHALTGVAINYRPFRASISCDYLAWLTFCARPLRFGKAELTQPMTFEAKLYELKRLAVAAFRSHDPLSRRALLSGDNNEIA